MLVLPNSMLMMFTSAIKRKISGSKSVVFTLFLLTLIGICDVSYGQLESPRDSMGYGKFEGLISPLTIPLVLSGNFGELRGDHFHTGLDMKTQGKEGFPVIAACAGVISRVKVSPYGYGRALYLSSPNGLTTVYAHLQRFAPVVEQWTLDKQYENQRFEVDEAPLRAFAFEQGDTIGWSGNSGGSGGPHLHFEVRETRTQHPINPFFWGFEIADTTPPLLQGLWVLPSSGSTVNGSSLPVRFNLGDGPIRIKGQARLAVEALDRLDAAANRCGVFRARLTVDDEQWFEWSLDTLDFSCNRDMNAHAVYDLWERTGEQIHRLHRLPGNRLPIYQADRLSQIIEGAEGQSSTVSIDVWDIHGNHSASEWQLLFQGKNDETREGQVLNRYNQSFTARNGIASAEIAAYTFYEDYAFEFEPTEDSSLWRIGSMDLPASRKIKVKLPVNGELQGASSGVAVRIGLDGKPAGSYSGRIRNGMLEFSTKTLGTYQLQRDTQGPSLSPHKRYLGPDENNLVIDGFDELRFNVMDELSGVESIEASLDGQWILMRWDPKRQRVWYELNDGKHLKGEQQTLIVKAVDEAGNRTTWKGTLLVK